MDSTNRPDLEECCCVDVVGGDDVKAGTAALGPLQGSIHLDRDPQMEYTPVVPLHSSRLSQSRSSWNGKDLRCYFRESWMKVGGREAGLTGGDMGLKWTEVMLMYEEGVSLESVVD